MTLQQAVTKEQLFKMNSSLKNTIKRFYNFTLGFGYYVL